MDWQAIGLSLRLGACTTAVLVVLGLPLAHWLANTRWRGRFLIEAIVALPIVLPPTVLGFYVLMAIGPMSPLGRFYESLVGHRLPFTFQGLLIASVLYSLPFAVQPFTSALATVDRRCVEASWCLGVSRLATFFRVTLPLAWPGVLTGVVLSFAHTIGEFGVVLMIGGNISGETRTVSISIYDQVQALDYAAANQTALALLIFSFAVLAATYGLQRKLLHVWPTR
ncbi:MAG TPA: molybdate ABC transporter permease subunit [Candidatus Paceibacterota bacterium]|nr:molybdate ABC transporter permease subunit [Candidatus Paceibacterota bacterium]